jgi:betaine-aldehyde dehydrogenase
VEGPSARLANNSNDYERLKNYIDGKREDSESFQVRDVINPATVEMIATAPLSTPGEVEKIVTAAQEEGYP